jgi:NDP-sugar pyrophosphorylase family protein
MADVASALVLTAGLGTRLRPLTLVRAKPAVPVAGEPLIRRIARWLTAANVSNLTLNLHHLPATITSVMGDGSDLGATVRYSWEQPAVLGSAGGPGQALPIVGADTFFIVNGDTLTDVDLGALSEAHRRSGALVTLALIPNIEPLKYGGVTLDAHDHVVGFVTRGPGATGSHHFVGVQVVNSRAFASIQPGAAAQSIGDVYDRLIAERPGSIVGFVSDWSFLDIGSVSDYMRATSQLRLTSPGFPTAGGDNTRIDPTARVIDSIIWNDVSIGREASVERCVVTDKVSIPAGATFKDQILIARDGAIANFPIGHQA